MKTIGLIGGMSWESTAEYYRIINEMVREKLGGLHSARVIMFSFDFDEIVRLEKTDNWYRATQLLSDAAKTLEKAGVDVVLICTNTMRKIAEDVKRTISIPLLHIATSTGVQVQKRGITRVGLLGTKFTMEQSFYAAILTEEFGFEVIIPCETDRLIIHNIIFNELCQGKIREESRVEYLRIIKSLQARGAEGIILGCTEIGLLIQDRHIALPLFDTTRIHAAAAVEYALAPTPSRAQITAHELRPTIL
jgi:aspartate racemase